MKEALSMIFLLVTVATSPALQSGDFSYTVNIPGDTVTVTGYTGSGGEITIPDTIESLPVTIIGYKAFREANNITGITIPDSVIEIGDEAFRDADNITSITIPDSVIKIGKEAFFSCSSLTQATIGDGVVDIESSAFLQCTKLTDLTIGNSVSTIGSGAFSGCSVVYVTLPDSVTSIGNSAFKSCEHLVSITIPDNVTTIWGGAFFICGALESITVGSGATYIGDSAFGRCYSLTNITVDAANPTYSSAGGVLFNKDQTTLLQFPGGKTGSYTIQGSVATIASSAFDSCHLTDVTVPDNVTTIGRYAFSGCRAMESIMIGNGVTSIGDSAFSGCVSLTNITVDAANPAYSSAGGVLFNKDQTTLLQFPGGKTGSYTIPGGVATIGDYAFASCPLLTNVTVPETVTTIGNFAFSSCSILIGVYFEGDAPDPGKYGDRMFQSSNNVIVYYLAGTTGWGAAYGGRPTALWLPANSITLGDPGITANQFGFFINGTSGQLVVVEANTTLTNSAAWLPLQTNTLGNTPLLFSDPHWIDYPTRCYRVHTQ